MKRITGATLFSGGGLAEARLADLIDFRLAVEFDPAIAAHYRDVYGPHVHCADVCAFDFAPYAGLGFLHASPPCTSASLANANRGETQKDLDMGAAVERAIVAIGPKVFTLENVGPYQEYQAFKSICTTLAALGYRADWRVYNSADFGVPQTRKRLILRAWRSEYGPLPEVEPTHASPAELIKAPSFGTLFSAPLLPWVGWYAAIEDLLPTCPESKLAPWQVKRLPKNIVDAVCTGYVLVGVQGYQGSIQYLGADEPAFVPNTTSGAGAYRAILVEGDAAGERPPATLPPDAPSFAIKTASGGRVHRVLINGIPSNYAGEIDSREGAQDAPPLTASSEKHPLKAVDGSRVVALTPRCLARFQSVPDSYPLPEKKSLAVKIIGNGVASAFFRALVHPLVEGAL
jgi:DNA (cytosine-5)-methyltransferase 1